MIPSWYLVRSELRLQLFLWGRLSLWVRAGESHRPPRSRSNLPHHEKPSSCFRVCVVKERGREQRNVSLSVKRLSLQRRGWR